MQIQMAHLCLLPQEQCNVQMSSGGMRARKATSSPRELSVQTVTGCVSLANSRHIVHSTDLSAIKFVSLVLLLSRRAHTQPVQMSLFNLVGVYSLCGGASTK